MEHKVNITLTDEQIKDHFLGHYYSDEDCEYPWEPFEDYSQEQIEEFIENDIIAFKHLLNIPNPVKF